MCIRLPNSCFVHIPRTGGLWFGAVVEALGIKHQTLKGDIDSHFSYSQLPPNWTALHSFSFIRDPFKWVRSRWSHALEINAYEDYRHYGVHREFDILIRPTLHETIKNIVIRSPGLVGRTYQIMTHGVESLLKTETLQDTIYQFLGKLEYLPEDADKTIETINPFNGTSSLDKYSGVISQVPDALIRKFINTEQYAYKLWESAL